MVKTWVFETLNSINAASCTGLKAAGWLAGWPVSWWAGWLAGWLAGQLAGRLAWQLLSYHHLQASWRTSSRVKLHWLSDWHLNFSLTGRKCERGPLPLDHLLVESVVVQFLVQAVYTFQAVVLVDDFGAFYSNFSALIVFLPSSFLWPPGLLRVWRWEACSLSCHHGNVFFWKFQSCAFVGLMISFPCFYYSPTGRCVHCSLPAAPGKVSHNWKKNICTH